MNEQYWRYFNREIFRMCDLIVNTIIVYTINVSMLFRKRTESKKVINCFLETSFLMMFEKCQGNTVASKYLWLRKTIVLPQLLRNNQPQRPWWHWTGNQMPLHDGKHSTCPILGKGSKGGDDSIWF